MNNIKNKVATKPIIENIINKYVKIDINNITQFQKAFVHKSFCIIDHDNDDDDIYCHVKFDAKSLASNERLEFLGDKVIDLITTEFLFDKYPKKDEGFLTKLKSKLVKKESLSKLGELLGFRELMLISSHVEKISGRNNPRFLEDIFESFMGTLYKDQNSDLKICKQFLLGVYSEFINMEDLVNNNDNYKDSLLRYFHSTGRGHPIYKNIYHTGHMYNRMFTSLVIFNKSDFKNISAKLYRKQKDILSFIKNDSGSLRDTEFSNIYDTIRDMMKTHIIIGIGKGTTIKASEQSCSKNCLMNLDVSVNY